MRAYKYCYLGLLVLVFVLMGSEFLRAQSSNWKIKSPGTVIANLEEGYEYGPFAVSGDYVAWINWILKKLYIWQNNSGEILEIDLQEGKGPSEVLTPVNMIVENNHITFLDPTLAKLVRMDIDTKKAEDIPTRFGVQDFMTIFDKYIYFMTLRSPDKMFYQYDFEGGEAVPFNLSGLDLFKEFNNLFFKQGTLLSNQKYVLLATKYRPYIYLLDRERLQYRGKFEWDISEVDTDAPQRTEDEGVYLLPPSKVNILTESAALVPRDPNHVFIVAKGKGRSRSYEKEKVYEFDLETKQFVAAHKLGIKAERIFSDNSYLYIYSKEEYKIYRFDIVSR